MKHFLLLVIILITVVSCSDDRQSGPVEIYYGEDICERCKMIISEKDFAAQYKLSNVKTVKFDDLGCMFHYMKKENQSISSVYVFDYSSKEWIDGKSAYYVWSENITTPMGHGLLAVKNTQDAQVLVREQNGQYLGDLKSASSCFLDDKCNNQD